MKVKILAGFMIITCLVSITGCDNLNLLKVTKNVEDKEKKEDNSRSILPDIKAFYGVAKLNDSLINNQVEYNNKELIYYEIYYNNKDLIDKVLNYGIEYDDPLKDGFDEEFFNKYILIAIYPGVTTSDFKYKIVDINNDKKKKDIWMVKITKEPSSGNDNREINPVIFISIKRTLYEKMDTFHIELI